MRTFFQWAADIGLGVLDATRAHDRRLSTVCGFYRFAHIDGRVVSNPAHSTCGVLRSTRLRATAWTGASWAGSVFTAERFDRCHAALAVLLDLNGVRVSEACATNIEKLGLERGTETRRIVGKGKKPAVIPLVPRTGRTVDLPIGERNQRPILGRSDGQRLDRRTAHRWVRAIGKRAGLALGRPNSVHRA